MLSLLTWCWIFLLLSTAAASAECPNTLFPGCKCEKTTDGYRVVCQEKHDINEVKKFLGLENAESSSTQVKVKDLMEKQAAASSSSTSSSSSTASPLEILNSPGGNMLASVLPSLIAQANGAGGAGMGSNGFLGSFANTIPALRNIPGFQTASTSGGATGDPGLDMAIAHFSEPIVRFAAGSKPVPADVHQMIGTLPDLIVNLPGLGNVDISQVPAPLLIHILRGGNIMGIPRSALDNLVRQYATRMYEAAARSKEGHPLIGDEKYLPRLHNASDELINIFWEGKLLAPYLSQQQIRTIQEYYDAQFAAAKGGSANSGKGTTTEFTMLNLLPPNYNLSKIPREVIKQVLSGQMPDFSLLPPDLIDYLRSNSQQLVDKFKGHNISSLEEILKNLPKYDPAQHDATTSPYDVNKVDSDLVLKEEGWMTSTQFRIFAASAIGFFVVVAIVIAAFFIYYIRKSGKVGSETVI